MVDLETLGFDTDCVVIQLGMCVFDENFKIIDTFIINIDPAEQRNRSRDPKVVAWWKQQPNEVVKSVFENDQDPRTAANAIIAFLEKHGDFWIWSNHILFDLTKLDSFLLEFAAQPLDNFTKYNQIEDFATIRDMIIRKLGGKNAYYEEINAKYYAERPEHLAHNALDDCIFQVYNLKYIDELLFD